MNKFQGWWNGLAVADLDGDGLLDFVATNWGRNTPFESLLQNGFLLAYGDISGRGRFETVEGIFDSVSKAWVPWQDRRTAVRNAPWLQETFPTVADYASAPLEQIHGPILSRKETLKVQWLASTVFLNRESSFEARVLPLQAQISPAFGVACGDFDGDGRIDLFLAQNFFGMEESFARLDAGQGLLLHGLGDGNFKAMNSLESGIRMLEEQQSAAVADVNQDGRLDLVVGTRNGPPQLYLNQAAAPALRVRLEGPPGNASGVGTVVRPDSGASQEVHAGNGYRSQDTTVLLVGGNRPKSLTIRFPWKPAFVVPVPTSGSEIVVNVDRSTRVVKP